MSENWDDLLQAQRERSACVILFGDLFIDLPEREKETFIELCRQSLVRYRADHTVIRLVQKNTD